ncbi:MAG: class I SAM-dependent methyltransferase [Terracidiphilus sp.]|jgi:SAM-dependent methyltransferase
MTSMSKLRRTLLTEFMMLAPYQPATNFWKSIEIEEVIKFGMPTGYGLDLGCGDGHLMEIILRHVGQRDLVGLDIDRRETALAQGRNIYREVINASADHLPFPDSQFDSVFSNSVLEHIQNIEGVLLEVARVLRPGGRFLFTVPGADFHRCLRGPRFFGSREGYLRETDARCYHLRYWDTNDWSEHLREAGLTQVHEHAYLSMRQMQRWESIARNTSGILYRLFGRKKQPIEIQRMMHLRNLRVRFPRLLASLIARTLDLDNRQDERFHGCLLIEAKKAATTS